MDERLKILVIRLSAIGDTIHTLPMVNALRKTYPDAQIDWLVEDKASLFVENNPLVDNVFVVPMKKWKKQKNIIKNFDEFNKIVSKLRKQNYDVAIDVQQLFKSGVFLAFSGAEQKMTLTGGREFSWLFANEKIKASHKLFDKNYHVVNRNMEIAKYLDCKDDSIEFVLPPVTESVQKKVDELLITTKKRPTLVLAPATTWETKHWENKYWADIIKEFQEKVNIVITGTEADRRLVDDILLYGRFKNIINLVGQTNLMELAEVFRRVDVVIAPDSGSAQIAWAVQKPFVISIFTATSKNRTAPFGENTMSFAPKITCYPCHKKRCFSKNFELCKSKIEYYEIIKILNELFK